MIIVSISKMGAQLPTGTSHQPKSTKSNLSTSTTTMTCPKRPNDAEREARLQEAITDYLKQSKKFKVSLNCIAKDFNVPCQTLKGRINGVLPHNKAQEELMHLTNEEEKELAKWITILTQRGYVLRYKTIHELVEIIRNRHVFPGVNDADIQLVKYDAIGKD